MRRTAVTLTALAAVLLGTAATVPASATTNTTTTSPSWEPAPSSPWDVAAGVRCDFPVHGEPVVDEVVQRVLDTYPDGSARLVEYKGALVVRVTNTDTGASYDTDVSGRALVEYRTAGSQFWSVHGPVLVGFGENKGTLARGLYTIDGVYTLDISATGYKTLTMLHGNSDDLCARID